VRILVVEDERKVARALREGLEAEHYDVRVAATGEEGFFLTGGQLPSTFARIGGWEQGPRRRPLRYLARCARWSPPRAWPHRAGRSRRVPWRGYGLFQCRASCS